MNLPYLFTKQNVTVIIGGQTFTAATDHPSYDEIKKTLCGTNDSLETIDRLKNLFDVSASITEYADGNVTVKHGVVSYRGKPVNGLITERIIQFMSEGIPVKPIINFLERLMLNPSNRAVEELFQFMEHKHMPITPNGFFRAYKGVRADFKDKYSGTIDNSVGAVPYMPRNEVIDDPDRPCSPGFHAGSLKYATDWAGPDGRLVIVEIDPANVVCIPRDCEYQKLKTFTYRVVSEQENRQPLNGVYVSDNLPATQGASELEIADEYDAGYEAGYDAYTINGYRLADDFINDEFPDGLPCDDFADGVQDGFLDAEADDDSNDY